MRQVISFIAVGLLIPVLSFCQTGWKLNSITDDYTLEKSHVLCHFEGNNLDAAYYFNTGLLKIIKSYDGSAFFDTCWNAKIYNDGYIDDYEGTIFCRLIYSKDFDEFELNDMPIHYGGYEDGDKIGLGGFYSFFWIMCEIDKLKKANYITFKYYDKITDEMVSKKISLSGFSKGCSLIKK